MRHIGSIPDQSDALRFGDYLLAAGMKNHVEEGSNGWAVWVEDDDKLDAAKTELAAFLANPADGRYDAAVDQAEKIRVDEEKRQDRRRKQFRDMRTSWGGSRQWAQPVTLVLFAVSMVVGLATKFGYEEGPAMNRLWIQSSRANDDGKYMTYERGLPDVRGGQVWRLITPIFIHYGPIHLLFNMFWLIDLGGQIERSRGSVYLLALTLFAAILSNLAQYAAPNLAGGGPYFGGMSGVNYALFGYVWIKGRLEPHLGMGVASQTVVIMLVWLVLCMTSLLGPVANVAHVVGLIVGVVAAYAPIEFRKLRRSLRS